MSNITKHAITFTLAGIKAYSPCERGYRKLCKSLGGVYKYGKDTPITIKQLYECNGYEDTLWCLRTLPEYNNLWRHFAVDCAKQMESLMQDERSKEALFVARKHADGNATDEQLDAARANVFAAAEAAACAAAHAVRWAAGWATGRVAAEAAAEAAAFAAGRVAAYAAGWASELAGAEAAARAAQVHLLTEYCRLGKRPDNSEQLLARYIKEELAND